MYSACKATKIGVPHGSVLGPLLFNVFIKDMFYFVGEADSTIYACDATIDFVIEKLEKHGFEMASWFSKIFIKLNEEKCHFMLYGEKSNDHNVNIGPALIKESTEVKLLGVTLF